MELINNIAQAHGGYSVFAGVSGTAKTTTCIHEMMESGVMFWTGRWQPSSMVR